MARRLARARLLQFEVLEGEWVRFAAFEGRHLAKEFPRLRAKDRRSFLNGMEWRGENIVNQKLQDSKKVGPLLE